MAPLAFLAKLAALMTPAPVLQRSLGPPSPKLLPRLYELLDSFGWREPLTLHPALLPGAVVQLTDSVLAEPSDVLPELL